MKARIRITVEVIHADTMAQGDSRRLNIRALDSAQVAVREWLGPTTPKYSIDVVSDAIAIQIGNTGVEW